MRWTLSNLLVNCCLGAIWTHLVGIEGIVDSVVINLIVTIGTPPVTEISILTKICTDNIQGLKIFIKNVVAPLQIPFTDNLQNIIR